MLEKPNINMKKLLIPVLAVCASATFAVAQTTTTVQTTTSSGTITEYAPGTTFIMKETAGPVTYSYGPTVTYVTRGGKVLTEEDVKTRVKVGAPVSVTYRTEGERRLIDRIEIDDD